MNHVDFAIEDIVLKDVLSLSTKRFFRSIDQIWAGRIIVGFEHHGTATLQLSWLAGGKEMVPDGDQVLLKNVRASFGW